MGHQDFQRIVENNWNSSREVSANLQSLTEALQEWNIKVFDNIFFKKNKLN